MKEIILTKGFVALVDDDDFEWLDKWTWCYSGNGYAVRGIKNEYGRWTTLKMHRLIMDLFEKSILVDHKDENGLNNTKLNLRACNRSLNAKNRGKNSNNTSGYKGVYWHNQTKKLVASITNNNKQFSLGLFSKAEDAYSAYCNAALKLHGDFANFGDGCVILKDKE